MSKSKEDKITLNDINPELLSVKTLKALLKACEYLEQIFTIRVKELAYDNTELNLALQNLNQIITFKDKLVSLIERITAIQNIENAKLKPIEENIKIAIEILNYIKEKYNINPQDFLIYILQKLNIEELINEIKTQPIITQYQTNVHGLTN